METATDIKGVLALWLVPGLGPRKITNLLEHFGTVEKILSSSIDELRHVEGITPTLAGKIPQALTDPRLQKELELIDQYNIKTTEISSEFYPKRLKEVYTAPPILYSLGTHDLSSGIPIAFVGARKASFSGKNFCRRLIKQLSDISSDIVIISGLALGIDTVAHQTALECGLKTVAVLAGGLSNIYPPQNRELSQEIQKNGALVTEFPVSAKPAAQNFPLRNRIISGLSKGIVVVEAGEKSGALITAGYAMEQNRDLFAAPGPADSTYYRGTNRLIQRSHAKLILDAEDIIEEISTELGRNKNSPKTVSSEDMSLSIEEMSIVRILEEKQQTADELSTVLNIPMPKLKSLLTMMELRGDIIALSGSKYAKT